MKTFAVLLAAGKSERFGSDKLWIDLQGSPLWTRSFHVLASHPRISGVGIVCQQGRIREFSELAPTAAFVVEGGATRQESSKIGVNAVSSDFGIVLVHDAARAYVTQDLVTRVIKGVEDFGAAFPCVPVTDTIKQGHGGDWSTLDRSKLVAVQTPQGARRDLLVEALNGSIQSTDEASLIEAMGQPVQAVLGDLKNIKITNPEDIQVNKLVETRIGFGYDIHAFSTDPERPMWLGGIEFDDKPGLEGHSDADVLIHAIVDALLGAVGLGDIGVQYPNTDPRWKNVSSILFLRETGERLRQLGWQIGNIDATVVAERPKVNPRRTEICRTLATALQIEPERISVKATTNEGLGSIGRGEGASAQAVATVSRNV